jgi:hypothetical protein
MAAHSKKKALTIGVLLALSFVVVLVLIFSPIFGEGRNGLQFSDDMFNKLAKGSSYFIPKVVKKNEGFMGKPFAVTLKMEKEKEAANAVKVLTKAGAQVEASGNDLKVSGDLGSLMARVLEDSDAMFKNDGKAVSELYGGMNEKDVMKTWFAVIKGMDKQLKKDGKIEEANHVTEVSKKAVETAYNFYEIEAQKVADKAVLMTGLLVFYVAYTMWWGFAIFFIFEGIGLSMKKAKVKKEV